MKFLASFLLVLVSIGLVTGQDVCIQGGIVPDCSSVSFGLRAIWSQESCSWVCPTKCPNGSAFRDCSGLGCSVTLCATGTTCYHDRCSGTKCVAKCVPNPTSPPPPPTVAPTQCAFGATIQELRSNTDFEISSPAVVHTAASAASLFPSSQAQLLGGIDGISTLPALFSFVEGGKINQYNVMYKLTGEMFVLYTYSAGENNHGWINPASESYRVARIGDESMYECRVAKNDGVVCPAVCKSVPCGPEGLMVEVCAAKVVNGKCTWPCPALTCAQQGKGCATMKCSTGPCVENPLTCEGKCPQVCTEKCAAKCSSGEKCVFDATCTPTCRTSTANTCVLNDGISRVVSGGQFYQQCNTCTCGRNGQPTVCTEKGCEDAEYNNDGTIIPPPVCTGQCTKNCPSGQKCVFDKKCSSTCRSSTSNTCVLNDGNSRIVSGGNYYHQCNQCTCGTDGKPGICTRIWCGEGSFDNDGTKLIQYPISFTVKYTGSVSQLATKLRKVATDAKIAVSLLVVDNTQLVKKSSTKSYQCYMAIKGPQDNTNNRDTYIIQLKKSFTIAGGVKLLENGDNNNDIQLDGEIQIQPAPAAGDAQPFTTQTCADDTTIPASDSCPAITEESVIIPTATSSSSSSFPLAIVVGSVVGGVIALVILTAAIIFIQRRRTANKVVARTAAEQEMTNTV